MTLTPADHARNVAIAAEWHVADVLTDARRKHLLGVGGMKAIRAEEERLTAEAVARLTRTFPGSTTVDTPTAPFPTRKRHANTARPDQYQALKAHLARLQGDRLAETIRRTVNTLHRTDRLTAATADAYIVRLANMGGNTK